MSLRVDHEDRITLDIYDEHEEDLGKSVREGLLGSPRTISSRFFYDDAGSLLFEKICELPEYYQTRTEGALLEEYSKEIARMTRAHDLVELGSGAASKTRTLLSALSQVGSLQRFIPFDVSEGIMRRVAAELVQEYPEMEVHAVVGSFTEHLQHIPEGSDQLCLLLGGTIGNFNDEEALELLTEASEGLSEGSFFLLGADRIKDLDILESAYNDSQGVTAAFNLNALKVLNSLFDGNFDVTGFDHRAIFNEDEHRIEMWVDAVRDQQVVLRDLDLTLDLKDGEGIRTEISTKYDAGMIEGLMGAAGFEVVKVFSDENEMFSLALGRKL